MRRTLPVLTLLLALATLAAAPAPPDDRFDDRVRASMAPYYAALLTSARGDNEGTIRHLVVLAARWASVRAAPATGRPAWAGQATVLDPIQAKIAAARAKAIARDAVGSHAELESIRAVLRDARERAGARTFDDAVTDYHEAMERLTGRAGLHNEIVLNGDDYAAIQEQIARAAAAWGAIQAGRGAIVSGQSWTGLAGATERTLAVLKAAATSKDGAATQVAAEALKSHYFELLALLART